MSDILGLAIMIVGVGLGIIVEVGSCRKDITTQLNRIADALEHKAERLEKEDRP